MPRAGRLVVAAVLAVLALAGNEQLAIPYSYRVR